MADIFTAQRVGGPLTENPVGGVNTYADIMRRITTPQYREDSHAGAGLSYRGGDEDRSVIGEAAAALGRGGLMIGQDVFELMNVAGQALHFDSLRDASRDAARWVDRYIESSPSLRRSRSITGSILDNPQYWTDPNWWTATIFEMVPMVVATWGTGALAGGGLRALKATKEAVRAGEFLARFGAYGGMEAGSAARDLRSFEESTGEEVPILTKLATVTGTGLVVGGIGMFPFEMVFGRRLAGGVISRSLKALAMEGPTEGLEEFVGNAIARAGYDPNRSLIDGVIEGVVGGVVVGGGMGAIARPAVPREPKNTFHENLKDAADDPVPTINLLLQAEQESRIVEKIQKDISGMSLPEIESVMDSPDSTPLERLAARSLAKERKAGVVYPDPFRRAAEDNVGQVERVRGQNLARDLVDITARGMEEAAARRAAAVTLPTGEAAPTAERKGLLGVRPPVYEARPSELSEEEVDYWRRRGKISDVLSVDAGQREIAEKVRAEIQSESEQHQANVAKRADKVNERLGLDVRDLGPPKAEKTVSERGKKRVKVAVERLAPVIKVKESVSVVRNPSKYESPRIKEAVEAVLSSPTDFSKSAVNNASKLVRQYFTPAEAAPFLTRGQYGKTFQPPKKVKVEGVFEGQKVTIEEKPEKILKKMREKIDMYDALRKCLTGG